MFTENTVFFENRIPVLICRSEHELCKCGLIIDENNYNKWRVDEISIHGRINKQE